LKHTSDFDEWSWRKSSKMADRDLRGDSYLRLQCEILGKIWREV